MATAKKSTSKPAKKKSTVQPHVAAVPGASKELPPSFYQQPKKKPKNSDDPPCL